MEEIGVLYVAYGRKAVKEAAASIQSLRKRHDWPVAVIGDEVEGAQRISWPDEGMPGRWAKVNLLGLSPWDTTLYLDADTRVIGDGLEVGFDILADGWELVMVASKEQSPPLHHLGGDERAFTLAVDNPVLMLNTGVMWFRRSLQMRRLFMEWAMEWRRFKRHDQGALLRALAKCPVRLWLLGQPFNGGDVVEHLFGQARG